MSQQPSPLLGFSLALIASMTWGSLPLAAQQVLQVMDAPTFVWSRFLVAAIVVFGLLWYRKGLLPLKQISRKTWLIIVMGVVGLTLNFTLYSQALLYISPTTNQVLWQFAPFGMIVMGFLLLWQARCWRWLAISYWQKNRFSRLSLSLIIRLTHGSYFFVLLNSIVNSIYSWENIDEKQFSLYWYLDSLTMNRTLRSKILQYPYFNIL